ncbi:uncharacterized protein LOC144130179 [Amblyomma americanum]
MSEHAEVIQMHHEKYGPHMRNFVRDNTVGACVWVFALSLAVLVILRMLKMIWGDIAAVVHLYKRYTAERRKGVTRNVAFHATALALLAADTSRMEALPVVGRSHTTSERAEDQAQEPTSSAKDHVTAGMQALPTSL